MGEGELGEVTLAMKCEHYDTGFCKYKNGCPQVHPNINCQGNCDDKRTCKNQHRILCKNSPTCEWKSCEFLHNTDQLEREYAETNADRKSHEDRIKKSTIFLTA